jgi:hypothetical protein
MKDHDFYTRILTGLPQRYKKLEQGHACASLHHYSVPAAMKRAGKYDLFMVEWIDKLIERQNKDGSISLKCDRGDKHGDKTADAACFAIILLLQDLDAFKPKGKKPRGGLGGRDSPFGSKKRKKEKEPEETPSAKPKPKPKPDPQPEPKKKKSPFGRD